MIQVYEIKNCDSVKKALKFFKEHNLPYKLHDFKMQKISCSTIASWLENVELKILFNARSTTYRNLKLKEKNLNEKEQEEWLCKENLLIKRPVIEYNDNILVGYNQENYTRSFL